MKCGKCKFKINIGNTEETGTALCSRVPSYFPMRAWYDDLKEKLLEGYYSGRYTVLPKWEE